MHHIVRFGTILPFFLLTLCAQADCPEPLAINVTNNQVRLTWPAQGSLQTSTTPFGPWSNLTNGLGTYTLPRTNPAAFFRLAFGPQIVSKESIFFYNGVSGAAAVGAVVSNQFVTRRVYSSGFAPGWTNITQIPGHGNPMFFHNPSTHTGAYGYLGADSYVAYLTNGPYSPWTHVEGTVKDGASSLLFYNATNGSIAWGNDYTPITPGWSHIVRARNSNLTLFYKSGDGSGALNFLPPSQVFAAGTLPTGATHVAAMPRLAGNDYVIFYNKNDGSGRLGVLDTNGFHQSLAYGPGSFGNWTHIIGLNGSLLFYSSEFGTGAIATMASDTNFVTVAFYPAGSFSTGWTSIARGDLNDFMQGFCWPESAAAAGTIDFYTSTGADTYSFSYVRLLNQSTQLVDFTAIQQNQDLQEQVLCGPYVATGRMQNSAHSPDQGASDWMRSFTLTIPSTWASGIYAVKLVDSAGSTTYVPFIVKPPPVNHGDFVLIADTTTWNAYNYWGGYSRYSVPGTGAWPLSYLRPNPINLNLSALDGSYQYHSKHLTRGELWVQNWLQGAGYRVDVVTDLDLHAGLAGLNSYKGLILSVHPEYFSVPMFKAITNYLAQGGHLIYLGANGLYDAVDVAADLKSLTVYGTDGSGRTHLFRELSPALPESAVLGIAYPWSLVCGDGANLSGSRVAYQVLDASHTFFAGTGLTNGSLFGAEGWSVDEYGSSLADGGASGWEIDVPDTNSPANLQLLARGTNAYAVTCSPYNVAMAGHMVYHQTSGGGFVFSVGSMTFGGSLVVDAAIQRIVRNALDACLH